MPLLSPPKIDSDYTLYHINHFLEHSQWIIALHLLLLARIAKGIIKKPSIPLCTKNKK
jgi:hypothetical protein